MIKKAFIPNFLKLYNMIWSLALRGLKKNSRLKQGFDKRVSADHLNKADIWIQAASAGEAYIAVELVKAINAEQPLKILITSTTRQGKEILEKHLIEKPPNVSATRLTIEWFPFDIPVVMQAAVNRISPDIMILLETEIWPALLYYLKASQIPVAIINARLSKQSFTSYLATRFIWDDLAPDLILATSDHDAERYLKIFNSSLVQTMSNIKFDIIARDLHDPPFPAQLTHMLPPDLPMTIIASVRRQEEKEVLIMIRHIFEAYPEQIIALFPRHMHRIKKWEALLTRNKISYVLRSSLKGPVERPCVILWDTFGELKYMYQKARVVFVGGSLKPLGGQNFLEPALQGIPTIIGPHYDNFLWVGDTLFEQNIVYKENNDTSAAQKIIEILNSLENRTRQYELAQAYVQAKKGGAQKACSHIFDLIDRGNTR